ncbi:MAG TPA: T9SS type A sorting domain-containing protein, partial [Flavobacteriales bacterium]|nr:T9SS type A sorting domain-containing protein [Flavobacteriales bacterium]
TGTVVDPGATLLNTMVGQIVALKLNVRFDELDPTFAVSDVMLKDMLIASGTFTGWTVNQLLTQADQAIGGCSTTYPLATLNTAVTTINNGYQGGTINNGYLICPGSRMLLENTDGEVVDPSAMNVTAFPNPMHDATTIVIAGIDVNERLSVRMYAANGAELPVIFEGMPTGAELRFTWNVEGRSSGLYFYQVFNGSSTFTGRLMVE